MTTDELIYGLAEQVIAAITARGKTIATAESLTGGLVVSALTSVPGASVCVRGGVVSYATDLKSSLLGVDAELLNVAGPVDERVALAMAQGVTSACCSDFGLATTGVAGPTEQNGVAVGTVFVAFWSADDPGGVVVRRHLVGDRNQIRALAVRAALELAIERTGS